VLVGLKTNAQTGLAVKTGPQFKRFLWQISNAGDVAERREVFVLVDREREKMLVACSWWNFHVSRILETSK
jgi:hypothetical protein